MSATATVAPDFKGRFYEAGVALLAEVSSDILVCFGSPGTWEPDEIVAFTRLSVGQEAGPISSSNRAREETIELDIVSSVHVPGAEEAERLSSDRAWELIRILENHVRTTDTTLGGLVRDCFLARARSQGFTVADDQSEGRTTEIVATFIAHVRITN